jgi:hypothetical protein
METLITPSNPRSILSRLESALFYSQVEFITSNGLRIYVICFSDTHDVERAMWKKCKHIHLSKGTTSKKVTGTRSRKAPITRCQGNRSSESLARGGRGTGGSSDGSGRCWGDWHHGSCVRGARSVATAVILYGDSGARSGENGYGASAFRRWAEP